MTNPVELYQFAVTIPAGNGSAATTTTNMTMPVRIITQIDITLPPGLNGTVGFQIAAANQPFFPRAVGAFYVASGRTITPPIAAALESGAWQLIGYNTGKYPHTIYVDFHCALVGQADQISAPVINPTLLSS